MCVTKVVTFVQILDGIHSSFGILSPVISVRPLSWRTPSSSCRANIHATFLLLLGRCVWSRACGSDVDVALCCRDEEAVGISGICVRFVLDVDAASCGGSHPHPSTFHSLLTRFPEPEPRLSSGSGLTKLHDLVTNWLQHLWKILQMNIDTEHQRRSAAIMRLPGQPKL